MDHICFALPILPGKASDVRDFQRELDGPRKADHATSEQRIGILLAYMEKGELCSLRSPWRVAATYPSGIMPPPGT